MWKRGEVKEGLTEKGGIEDNWQDMGGSEIISGH